mgnify:CR=1 FL=1
MTKQPTKKILQELHLKMVRIRRFEEEAGRLMEDAKIPGALHLYVGQEAVASGVMQNLNDADQITSTHRGHGHLVAKGGEFPQMYAELYGKATGYCKGKGGSMHVSNMDLGMLGANGIVGGGPPIAMGAAFANQFLETKNVSVAFFGDGASNQGQVYEAFNMAELWKLPIIYVIENNQYAMGTALKRSSAQPDLHRRGESFAITGLQVDGMDVMAVKAAGEKAIAHCRDGKGPIILEMMTYRYRGHSMSDPAKYRTKEEVAKVRKERDPIDHVRDMLLDLKISDEVALKAIDKEVKAIVTEAAEYAQHSPEPDPSELYTDVLIEV